MKRSRIEEFLFGMPDRPMSRAERIETIKKRIRDPNYVTEEKLDAALERMLEEIRADSF